MSKRRHTKLAGFVELIEGSDWYARLRVDGRDFSAHMMDPLPDSAQEGSLFTIHMTKRGHTYVYWCKGPIISRHQLKKIRIHARALAKELREWDEYHRQRKGFPLMVKFKP